MIKLIISVYLFVLCFASSNAFGATEYDASFLDMKGNQVALSNNGKLSLITTRATISSAASEKECLYFLKKKPFKTCISYQIIIPNYNNEFGIFIKTEFAAQELIGKTVFKYDFRTKTIINVQNLLPQEIQKSGNFWMWYGSSKIGYTTWDRSNATYTQPATIDPAILR